MSDLSDFGSLLEAQIPRLRRYARALLRDASRADDLVQDTLVRAIAKQHLWQPDTNLRAWLFTLMHNLYVNVVRQSLREGAMVDVEDLSTALIATTDPTVSCQLRELEDAIARLPNEQREVVLLIGLEGVPYEEAAMILRVPIGTVRSRLSRARASLRKALDRDEEAVLPATLPARMTVAAQGA
jgi:RNA polymerase sigma-70 factor, ECF subfamily